MMWVLVAVLLLGGGGAGIYFATRGKGNKSAVETREADRDKPDRDKDDRDKDDLDRPDPDRDKPDKWDRTPGSAVEPDDDDDDHAHSHDPDSDESVTSGVPGGVVDVAQGVRIIAPPGMPVTRQAGAVVIGDITKVAIIGFPITERGNAEALARSYAKQNGLKLQGGEPMQIAGETRTVYGYLGTVNGFETGQVAVPLLGSGYRVGVIIHVTKASGADPKQVEAFMKDVLTRRILVPSRAH
jgi:hypothetical protein